MIKIIELDPRFPTTGEPTVQPVVLWGRSSKPLYEKLSKEASHSPAIDYIRSITPIPGRTISLILGVSAYEYYGANRNADGFNERPYNVGIPPKCGCCPPKDAWVTEQECVQHHYHTYEQGHVYKHHVNKDPAKCIGKILKAFWNPFMHRVEVLEDLDNSKDPELAQRIVDGEYPAKSMGCRIQYDVCTKCGHRSPTRAKYCDHAKFELGRLNPDGTKNAVLNPSPKYFDSSWVLRPADRTGYMLLKVAEHPYEIRSSSALGDRVQDLEQKSAMAKKLAVIDKIVRGYPACVVSHIPEGNLVESYRKSVLPSVVSKTQLLDRDELSRLPTKNIPSLLASLSRAGVILTTPEFMHMFLKRLGYEVPQIVLEKITAIQSEIFQLFSEFPSFYEKTSALFNSDNEFTAYEKVAAELRQKRGTVSDFIHRQVVPEGLRDEKSFSDIQEVIDPYSGKLFQTTRGASRAAEDAISRGQLVKTLGGAALLAGTYKMLSAFPKTRWLSLPATAGLAVAGWPLMRPDAGAQYPTTENEPVSSFSEFVEKRGSTCSLNAINALGLDYQVRNGAPTLLYKVAERSKNACDIYKQLLNKVASLDNTCSLSNYVTKLATDGITEENLDFEHVAHFLGEVFLT